MKKNQLLSMHFPVNEKKTDSAIGSRFPVGLQRTAAAGLNTCLGTTCIFVCMYVYFNAKQIVITIHNSPFTNE